MLVLTVEVVHVHRPGPDGMSTSWQHFKAFNLCHKQHHSIPLSFSPWVLRLPLVRIAFNNIWRVTHTKSTKIMTFWVRCNLRCQTKLCRDTSNHQCGRCWRVTLESRKLFDCSYFVTPATVSRRSSKFNDAQFIQWPDDNDDLMKIKRQTASSVAGRLVGWLNC